MRHRFCVAPLMDWTDRHCRYFHRLIAPQALLYTEMVTAQALMHGDLARHLDFSSEEHPVALQVGGSEPDELARAARLGEQWGYDEINLNCGCPSERVQRGAFGACLMAEPELVAQCIRAMADAVGIPVTVKHRIGIDHEESYTFLARFVEVVAGAGCKTFVVHARNAWLKGLSPKQNREVPPLRYDLVFRLKQDFPELEIVLNGGLTRFDEVLAALEHVDGVMWGREAYQHPYKLAEVGPKLFGSHSPIVSRAQIVLEMRRYAQAYLATPAKSPPQLRHVARHMLGLFAGCPGARNWRRTLSDPQCLASNDPDLLMRALEAVEAAALEEPGLV
ncbi:MAG: tRNA dihydrouridine(20/20a) synthase DusA [Burkholderiaceae bacterium]